jgi:hypothetical protein
MITTSVPKVEVLVAATKAASGEYEGDVYPGLDRTAVRFVSGL